MSSKSRKTNHNYGKIHTIILAAGKGRRLGALTANTPKCLLEVAGAPILHHQLHALSKNGVRDVAIVVGFMAENVKEYAFGYFPDINFLFVDNESYEHTNTLYSLALAAESLKKGTRTILMNGDVVFDSRILALLLSQPDEKSYIATQYRRCGAEEIKVTTTGDGLITALNKNIDPAAAIGEAIGINIFSPSHWMAISRLLSSLKKTHPHEYFEYAIEKTIENGLKINALNIYDLYAVEIDFPDDLTSAGELFHLA